MLQKTLWGLGLLGLVALASFVVYCVVILYMVAYAIVMFLSLWVFSVSNS